MVVVTHHPPEDWPRGGVAIFFETSVEAAVAQARKLAGDRDVSIAGATITRGCLDAGLLDAIRVSLVPVILGDGIPWLAGTRGRCRAHKPQTGGTAEKLAVMIDPVLADLWPPYGLIISTPRLELRLPHEEELAALAHLAGEGVHGPDERPFLTPWTEGPAEDRRRFVLQEHWGQLGQWTVAAWQLGLGVFRQGEPLGMVTLRARDFLVVREVATFSWLGLGYQGKGYGTEARVGLLTLAFDHLGARAARTEVFQDNAASQRVSRKLGYEPDGISVDARGSEAVVSDRLRLTREKWAHEQRTAVRVQGMTACRPMFGL